MTPFYNVTLHPLDVLENDFPHVPTVHAEDLSSPTTLPHVQHAEGTTAHQLSPGTPGQLLSSDSSLQHQSWLSLVPPVAHRLPLAWPGSAGPA